MDAEFIFFVLSMSITMSATYAILRFDEMHMSEAQFERAWPPSSRNAAVLAFSPICLVVHFTRTRMSFRGALLGVGAAGLIVGFNLVVSLLVDALVH